jgi:hypothetical protein
MYPGDTRQVAQWPFIASGDKKDWALEAFPNKDGHNYTFQKGILSRKSQIVPALTAVVQKYA